MRLLWSHIFFLGLNVDAVRQDKYVVLGPSDNLGRVAKQNGVTVADIVKWNGLRNTRQLGIGTKLIVAKGGRKGVMYP